MALSSHDSLPKLLLWKPKHDHQGKAEAASEPNRMSAELSQEDPDDPTLELLRIMTPCAGNESNYQELQTHLDLG
jgi:hypothetical protein